MLNIVGKLICNNKIISSNSILDTVAYTIHIIATEVDKFSYTTNSKVAS